MLAVKLVFWIALAALLWTHVLYPLAAAALARLRTRAVRRAEIEPLVTVIVAAYNEEAVIERRLENLLDLDYPAEQARARRHLRRLHRSDARARRALRRPAFG